MEKKAKNGLRTLIGVGVIVGASFLTMGINNKANEREAYDLARSKVEQILEVDETKGLSDSEMKRFYDETGISPYTHSFKSLSRKDLEQFLSNYKQIWVRK